MSPVPLCAISRQVVTRPRALRMIPIRHDGCTLITSRPPIPPVHLPQRAQGMARVVLFKHYRSGQPPAQIRVSTPCQLARRRRRRTVIGVHPDATNYNPPRRVQTFSGNKSLHTPKRDVQKSARPTLNVGLHNSASHHTRKAPRYLSTQRTMAPYGAVSVYALRGFTIYDLSVHKS